MRVCIDIGALDSRSQGGLGEIEFWLDLPDTLAAGVLEVNDSALKSGVKLRRFRFFGLHTSPVTPLALSPLLGRPPRQSGREASQASSRRVDATDGGMGATSGDIPALTPAGMRG